MENKQKLKKNKFPRTLNDEIIKKDNLKYKEEKKRKKRFFIIKKT
jgi:hypothetical protein